MRRLGRGGNKRSDEVEESHDAGGAPPITIEAEPSDDDTLTPSVDPSLLDPSVSSGNGAGDNGALVTADLGLGETAEYPDAGSERGGAEGHEDTSYSQPPGEVYAIQQVPIGEILLQNRFIDADDLVDGLRLQQESGRRLGEVLVGLGVLDPYDLATALGQQLGIMVADLRVEQPEPGVLNVMPERVARTYTALPLRVDGDRLEVVIADPLDNAVIEGLVNEVGAIAVMIAPEEDIRRMIDTAYSALAGTRQHVQAFEVVEAVREVEIADTFTVDENAPVVQVVNLIITQAVRRRASDIHVEPTGEDIRIRYRIDGALSDAIRLPEKMGQAIVSRVKVMSDMNIVERRRSQDGQFTVEIDGRPLDARVATTLTINGEKVVMRLLEKGRTLLQLEDLGMPHDTVESYMELVRAPLGMVICTGPTGSGKTTTLYATLAEINDVSRNVMTIEDPVEYVFSGINQLQINEQAAMTFATGLKAILRQDPDIILVGEIRDVETARIAVQSALTGHFVLSSMHSVDAAAALHRFLDMGIESFLVSSAVNGVVGQRLVRRNCPSCLTTYEPPPEHRQLFNQTLNRDKHTWIRGLGCNFCNHTGYQERIGVYELLRVTDTIRDMLTQNATHREIRAQGVSDGMRTMQVEALRLVEQDITTVDEVIRSVYVL
ncbi:MAG: hypothetical protein JJLCMIEE_02179 [Acidimicrobiales bacterium]|nr:hypothetical protein [Acidimicrobiales bacterium]